MLGDQCQQARGRIGAMDGARGALEVRQHFDEHGVPVGLTDEKFRDTGGRLRHGESGGTARHSYKPNLAAIEMESGHCLRDDSHHTTP